MFPESGDFPLFGGKIWLDAHGSCSYECALCKNKFFSAGSFEFHIAMEHSNDMKAISFGQSNKNRAKNGNRYDTHSSSSNGQWSNAHTQSSGRKERHPSVSQLNCTKCTKRFDSLEDLREHVRGQHQFECVYCPKGTIKSYETQHGLWLHQRNHHETKFPYKCKVCIRAFKRREHLQEHKELKHARGNTDVQCDFCSKMLMSVFEKENHIKKEHSDRRYYCFLCTEYWTTCQKNLRRHTKEKHPGRAQPKR